MKTRTIDITLRLTFSPYSDEELHEIDGMAEADQPAPPLSDYSINDLVDPLVENLRSNPDVNEGVFAGTEVWAKITGARLVDLGEVGDA